MQFNLTESIKILDRTPGIVRDLVSGLDPQWTQSDYGVDTWSVHQVVGHLIWGERTDWIPRIIQMLESGDSQAFVPFDRSGHSELCKTHTIGELLSLFDIERKENIRKLISLDLTADMLESPGLHPGLGGVNNIDPFLIIFFIKTILYIT